MLVISRTEAEVAAVAADIRGTGGAAWHAVGDVASSADVDRIVSLAEERWAGRIDVLVNNAGIDHDCPFLEFPEAEWRRVLDVNLTGPFLWAQRVARAMAGSGGGAIVHVASIDALGADGTQVAYNTSKAGSARPQPQPVDRARAARHPLDGREPRLRRDAADAPVRRRGDVRVHDDELRARAAGPDGRRPTRSRRRSLPRIRRRGATSTASS